MNEDIFRTNANTSFNSFDSPINPINMNGGNWGIDSNYLTPAFSAPYRPSYSGPTGDYSNDRPGFFRSSYNMLSPFAPNDPMHSSPSMSQNGQWESIYSKPRDAFTYGLQRAAVPLAAVAATNMMMNRLRMTETNPITRQVFGKATAFFGGSQGAIRRSMATSTFGWGMGSRMGAPMGGGIASAFGASGGMLAGARNVAGFVGGAAGAMALPYLAVEGITRAANHLAFDPIMTRSGISDDLRSNFANVYMGDNNTPSGFGLSNGRSSRMAGELNNMGINDMTFGVNDMRGISDMAVKSGMLTGRSTSSIVSRIKSIKDNLKLVMAVADEANIGEAMQILSKLQSGGAVGRTAGTAMHSMGFLSAQAGVSTQRMMNTVGAQGQYMYQANGLTPYLGQIAAGNAYASFISAQRSGLINEGAMARMGGVEGASQLAMTGQLNVARSTYGRMMSANNHMFGGAAGGGGIGDIMKFSRNAAADPTGTYAMLQMHGDDMTSADMALGGPGGAQQQAMKQMMSIARLTGKVGKNGKVRYEDAAAILMQITGDPQQAKAMLLSQYEAQDPTSIRDRVGAINAQGKKMQQAIMNQEGLDGSFVGLRQGFRRGVKGVQQFFNKSFGSMSDGYSDLVDNVRNGYYNDWRFQSEGGSKGLGAWGSYEEGPGAKKSWNFGDSKEFVDKDGVQKTQRQFLSFKIQKNTDINGKVLSYDTNGIASQSKSVANLNTILKSNSAANVEMQGIMAEIKKRSKSPAEAESYAKQALAGFSAKFGLGLSEYDAKNLAPAVMEGAQTNTEVTNGSNLTIDGAMRSSWAKVTPFTGEKEGDVKVLDHVQVLWMARKALTGSPEDLENYINRMKGLPAGTKVDPADRMKYAGFAKKQVRDAYREGILSKTAVLDEFGGDASKAMAVAAQDPATFFGKDAKGLAAYNKARSMAGGTPAEQRARAARMQSIVTQHLQVKNGIFGADRKALNTADYGNTDAILRQAEATEAENKQLASSLAGSEGDVDMAGVATFMASMKLSEGNQRQFSSSVEKFAQAVENLDKKLKR